MAFNTARAGSITVAALEFFNTAERTLINLYERWQDEKKCENIEDYALPLQAIAEKAGVKIKKMHGRPFGCTFTVGVKQFKLKLVRNKYSYTRVA